MNNFYKAKNNRSVQQNFTSNTDTQIKTNTVSKAEVYALAALMALNSTGCGDNTFNQNNYQETKTEVWTDTVSKKGQTVDYVDYTDNRKNDKYNLSEAQKKAIKTIIPPLDDISTNPKKKKTKITIFENGFYSYITYDMINEDSCLTLNMTKHWNLRPNNPTKIKINQLPNDNFTIETTFRNNGTTKYEFHKNGDIVSAGDYYLRRQESVKKDMANFNILDNTNKKMLSAILSSMNIQNIDAIEDNGQITAFAENEDASYEFIIRKSEDNNLYGIIHKMTDYGEVQSKESDGTSEIYAFKCTDKSTSKTDRMQVTLMRIVQDDIYNEEDTKKKYNDRTYTNKRVKSMYVNRGGLFRKATAVPTEEETFTTNYLSEGAENIMYTLDEKGLIKINGKSLYYK